MASGGDETRPRAGVSHCLFCLSCLSPREGTLTPPQLQCQEPPVCLEAQRQRITPGRSGDHLGVGRHSDSTVTQRFPKIWATLCDIWWSRDESPMNEVSLRASPRPIVACSRGHIGADKQG